MQGNRRKDEKDKEAREEKKSMSGRVEDEG